MRISTLLYFLFGDRDAILTIARTPHACWIALLLVLTGGLARNYDKEPVFHEPIHVFGPLLVSTLIGAGLFLVLYGAVRLRGLGGPGIMRAFVVFITLYWMTAPMAWLYGIPTERVMDIVAATELNLWTLALVSVWRVLLIAYVASVIFGTSMFGMLILTCAYSNIVVTGVLIATPFPVINIMGGIELSQSEALISGIATNIFLLSFITIPVLVLGSVVAACFLSSAWRVPEPDDGGRLRVHRSLIMFSVAAMLFWLAPLPFTQPAQSLRYRTESALFASRIDEGVQLMLDHAPEAYPPHWDPPPRRLYGETGPDVLAVMQHLIDRGAEDEWVATRYEDKLFRNMRRQLRARDLQQFAAVAKHIDSAPELLWENRQTLLREMEKSHSAERKASLQRLQDMAKEYASANGLEWDDDPD